MMASYLVFTGAAVVIGVWIADFMTDRSILALSEPALLPQLQQLWKRLGAIFKLNYIGSVSNQFGI